MQETLPAVQEADARERARAIASATEAELLEIARTLVGSTPASLFGANEIEVRDIILRVVAKAYEQHLARKKRLLRLQRDLPRLRRGRRQRGRRARRSRTLAQAQHEPRRVGTERPGDELPRDRGLTTVRDLVIRSDDELLEVRNFGETTLKEVKIQLQARGLALGMLKATAGKR